MSPAGRLALAALLAALACGAQGAAQDWVNGRMVGKPLRPMQLTYHGPGPGALEGKVVLVDYWGTWCEACRHSMPRLNRLHEELGERGLVVVGVTRDDDKSIAEFTERIPLHYFIGIDADGAFFKRMSLRAMPYAMLVDRSGKIVWQGDPDALTRDRIEAALDAPPP
jgi:thiol-disulfide isomerase/thioredoxin